MIYMLYKQTDVSTGELNENLIAGLQVQSVDITADCLIVDSIKKQEKHETPQGHMFASAWKSR